MPASSDPTFGINYGWDLDEDGWKAGMDFNLQLMAALLKLTVVSRSVGTPPGSPVAFDTYIVPATGTTGDWVGKENQLAVRFNGTWNYFPAWEGAEFWVADVDQKWRYDGSAWVLASNGTSNGVQLLQLPTEFQPANYDIPVNIYRTGPKRYETDFDPRAYRLARPVKYYVDPVLGSDAANGLTQTTAFKTLKHAISIGGEMEIECFPGKYFYVDGPQGEIPDAGINIVCTQGVAEFSNEAIPRYWTESVTYPGLYETASATGGEDWFAVGSSLRFFISAERGASQYTGGGRRIPNASNIASIEGGAIGVNIGPTITSIRLPNNINPNGHKEFKVLYASPNLVVNYTSAGATHHVYLENLRFGYGSPYAAIFRNDREDCNVTMVGCESGGGHSDNGISFTCNGTIVMSRCKSESAYLDGFNYHISTTSGLSKLHIFEHECVSQWNGKDPGGTNNGSTIHEELRIIRLNCTHINNQNRNVHDVNASYSFNVGIECRGGQDFDQPSVMFGRDGAGDTTTGWMVGGNVTRLKVATGATLHLDEETRYDELIDDGTVVDYEIQLAP